MTLPFLPAFLLISGSSGIHPEFFSRGKETNYIPPPDKKQDREMQKTSIENSPDRHYSSRVKLEKEPTPGEKHVSDR